ncbi:alanine racemase [Chamaesiphon polymorphus]|uniref:Alanine racemase n=1 Tax=Chamaesiphon polymorphus CCALA 037 TaxID=2107692 RepID=A0A2T1GND6_9CYAN|nr:alanine racemase [Chamaesiphon polymorphus]PSB59414.1 alanine racemase [Chamaesiphon polymorphus CCALA 037]
MASIDREWEQQRAWVEIDLAALVHNVRQVRGLLKPDTKMMAVVKADAYGHGAIVVARTLVAAGVEWLAVATVPEGIELRAAGIGAPILLLGAIHTDMQVRAIVEWDLQPTICTIPQATTISKSIAKLDLDKPLNVHLKLDTGMSRLGTNWQQAESFYREVSSLPYLKIGSLYSHLATADAIDPTVMEMQLDRFARSIAAIESAGYVPPLLHLANSAGILATDRSHYHLVRPGLILYGLCPAPHLQFKIDLQPVLSVKARVTQVKEIAAGTGVSYGYRFIADRDLQIAVVEIGYADGIPRRLSNRMQAIVRGQLVPQIGTITMDRLMLDVSQIPDLQVDEIVTILGRDGSAYISADDWANELETISWEILCGFKPRLPRASKNE